MVPAPVPTSASPQPRTVPTARTMVSAATNSTSDARNEASTVPPACAQTLMSAGGRGRVEPIGPDCGPAPEALQLIAAAASGDLVEGGDPLRIAVRQLGY